MKRKLINGAPKREVLQKVNNDIDESTISNEASTCALMVEALSILLNDIDWRIRSIYAKHGIIVRSDDTNILTGMSRYCHAVRMAMAEYEKSIRSKFEDCTFGYGGAEKYDSFRRSSNDVARLVMKLCDKGKADGVLTRIEEFIDTFEAQGRFTEDDYQRFILK